MSKGGKRGLSDAGIIALIILVIVAGGAGILWSIMGNGREVRTTSTSSTKIMYLDCEKTGLTQGAFFASDKSNTSTQRVKLAFGGDSVQKAVYTYSGVFQTEEIAKSEIDRMQGEFYSYVGEINMDISSFESGFTVSGTRGIVNVFIEKDYLNDKTAKLVFLDDEAISKLGKANASTELKKIYENKGFTCNNGS